MRWHVDRNPRDAHGKIGPVIQIEPAQVVLIGLPLAAVLTNHQPRHRFEHLARARYRPGFQLSCCDGALRCRAGDANQAPGGVVDLGEISERAMSGHRNLGRQRQGKHNIEVGRAIGRERHFSQDAAEID